MCYVLFKKFNEGTERSQLVKLGTVVYDAKIVQLIEGRKGINILRLLLCILSFVHQKHSKIEQLHNKKNILKTVIEFAKILRDLNSGV